MSINASSSPIASPAIRAASGPLPEGAVFAGRYRVVRGIAAGGMGAVYEVIHTETERRRALKVMHPHLFQSNEMRERFKGEARIAAQVESEYIVDVSDAGVDEATQTPFIVMELLQGEELGHRLARLGHFPPAEVITYLQQIALALDKTHAKSIVHRDLKPENVFLTTREDGSSRIKILDFGVAKLVAEGATAAGATRSLGTPLYMAPEQFRVGSKLMPSADIYALGMMAYALLVGQHYWAAEARSAGDVIAFAMAVVQGPQESAVRRAAELGVMLPPGFDGWFARVAAASAADRYPTASEAVWALGQVFGVTPGVAAATAPAAARISQATVSLGTPPFLGMATPEQPSAPAFPGTPYATGSRPYPIAGTLEPATTPTGAAVKPIPPERSGTPLLAAFALLLGIAVLGAGAWIATRALSDGGGAVSTATQATSREPAMAAPSSPSPSALPVPAEPASAAAEPAALPSAPSARPALTGKLPAAKPSAATAAKPSAAPAAKPAGKSLIGRD